jgi:hypothetical protein
VIINNEKFKGEKLKDLENDDAKHTPWLLSAFHSLHFRNMYRENLSSKAMLKTLEDVALEQDLRQHDALCVFFLSHGSSNTVVGSDGKDVHIRDILQIFSDKNCPQLKGKPKLFFVHACRSAEDRKVKPKFCPENDEIIPYSDMILCYSTVNGFSVEDHLPIGSDYCCELARILYWDPFDKDLIEILNLVDKKVQGLKRTDGKKNPLKQITSYTTIGFNKKLYFHQNCNCSHERESGHSSGPKTGVKPITDLNAKSESTSSHGTKSVVKSKKRAEFRLSGRTGPSLTCTGYIYLDTDDGDLLQALADPRLESTDAGTAGIGLKLGNPVKSKDQDILLDKLLEKMCRIKDVLENEGYDTRDGERRLDVTEMARNRVGQDKIAFEKLIVFKQK